MTRATRRIDWRFAALALGLCVVLGFFGLFAGTDPDEEYALASTAHGLAYALHRAIFYELQAPVWFGLVALWRSIDESVGFARLFSILCAAATCFALRSIALRVRPAGDPLPFTALVVLNPFFIYAALDVRVYAFALLLGALTWIAFYDGYFAGETRGARLRFGLLALVSIYTFYYLAFALAGYAAALLIARRLAALRAFAVVAAGLVVASIPALLAIAATFADVRAALPPVAHVSLRGFLEPILLFALPTSYRWSEIAPLASLLHVYKPIVIVVALALLAALPRPNRRDAGLIALAAVVWLAYPLAYLFVHVRFEVPRHYVTLFVPLAAAAYVLAGSFSNRHLRSAPWVAAVAYVAFCGLTLWANYGSLSKAGDMRRVGAFVSAQAAAGDVVAVFAPDAEPAFRRFYTGVAPVVAFPREPDPERYDTSLYRVGTAAEAETALRAPTARRRLWLVLYGRCEPDSDNYGCANILAALRARFPRARVTDFYETEVVELAAGLPRKNAGRSPSRGSNIAAGEMPAVRQKKAPFKTIASAYVRVFAAAAPIAP